MDWNVPEWPNECHWSRTIKAFFHINDLKGPMNSPCDNSQQQEGKYRSFCQSPSVQRRGAYVAWCPAENISFWRHTKACAKTDRVCSEARRLNKYGPVPHVLLLSRFKKYTAYTFWLTYRSRITISSLPGNNEPNAIDWIHNSPAKRAHRLVSRDQSSLVFY
jgi:hypothetical protein